MKVNNNKMSDKEVYDNLIELSNLILKISVRLDSKSNADKKDIYKLNVMYSDLREIRMKYFRKYKKM